MDRSNWMGCGVLAIQGALRTGVMVSLGVDARFALERAAHFGFVARGATGVERLVGSFLVADRLAISGHGFPRRTLVERVRRR